MTPKSLTQTMQEAFEAILDGDRDAAREFLGELSADTLGTLSGAAERLQGVVREVLTERAGGARTKKKGAHRAQ